MKVSFDYRQLIELANKPLNEKAAILKAAQDELCQASLALERGIKSDMPVDTGRARASWGHWTPGDIVGSNAEATPGDAVYEVRENNLEIEQGSNVPYIAELNDGHSKQAPAGFIDRRVKIARQVLNERVRQIFIRHLK